MKIRTIINDITFNTTVENNLSAKEFLEIFHKHGFYYELGNAWNLTAVKE